MIELSLGAAVVFCLGFYASFKLSALGTIRLIRDGELLPVPARMRGNAEATLKAIKEAQ